MKRLRALALFSVLCALAAHFGIFYFLGIRAPMMRIPAPQRFEVQYLDSSAGYADPVVIQQSILLDSAPLFMPTRWNLASEMSEVASLQQATEVFSPFPPSLDLPGTYPTCPWSPPSGKELQLPVLADDPSLLLARFGREARSVPERVSTSSKVSALRLDGSPELLPVTISLPPSLNQQSPVALWNPVRFYLQITEDIPVGSPLLVQSSGFSEWDEALQSFVGSLEFYRSIESGYYRISIFP